MWGTNSGSTHANPVHHRDRNRNGGDNDRNDPQQLVEAGEQRNDEHGGSVLHGERFEDLLVGIGATDAIGKFLLQHRAALAYLVRTLGEDRAASAIALHFCGECTETRLISVGKQRKRREDGDREENSADRRSDHLIAAVGPDTPVSPDLT